MEEENIGRAYQNALIFNENYHSYHLYSLSLQELDRDPLLGKDTWGMWKKNGNNSITWIMLSTVSNIGGIKRKGKKERGN